MLDGAAAVGAFVAAEFELGALVVGALLAGVLVVGVLVVGVLVVGVLGVAGWLFFGALGRPLPFPFPWAPACADAMSTRPNTRATITRNERFVTFSSWQAGARAGRVRKDPPYRRELVAGRRGTRGGRRASTSSGS